MKRFIAIAAMSIIASIAASTQMAPAQTAAPQPEVNRSTFSLDEVSPANAAGAKEVDGSNAPIKTMMHGWGMRYEEREDGSLKIVLKLTEGRSQVIWISAGAGKLGDAKLKRVYSPGYFTEGGLSNEVANQFLEDTQNQKLGSWGAMDLGDDKTVGLFMVKFSADSSPEMVKTAILAAALGADRMEAQLMEGSDRF